MDAHLEDRRRTHDALAARLEALSDERLADVLAVTNSWRINMHGNQSGVIDFNGAKVFVKKIALTDLERTAKTTGATANLFELPNFYHYGVISSGFGAWRELLAHQIASAWALAGECAHFPLIYHWRVLPRPCSMTLSPEQIARIQRGVDHWEHSNAVRARLEAIFTASAVIVLFVEHVPTTLRSWLSGRTTGAADADLAAAILAFHDQWRDTAAFMNERGMLHFDLNPSNVLTDGRRVYVADFGLALCLDFDLSQTERSFFETHRTYDRCYVAAAFVEWLTHEANPPPIVSPALRALLNRYAPVASVFTKFLTTLSRVSKTTPYPASELEVALAR